LRIRVAGRRLRVIDADDHGVAAIGRKAQQPDMSRMHDEEISGDENHRAPEVGRVGATSLRHSRGNARPQMIASRRQIAAALLGI